MRDLTSFGTRLLDVLCIASVVGMIIFAAVKVVEWWVK